MSGCDRSYLQAYIDEFCWRRNCSIQDKNVERSKFILNEFLRALNRHFPVGSGIEVDFTDRFANCYDFDPTDEGWLKDVDFETSSSNTFYIRKHSNVKNVKCKIKLHLSNLLIKLILELFD